MTAAEADSLFFSFFSSLNPTPCLHLSGDRQATVQVQQQTVCPLMPHYAPMSARIRLCFVAPCTASVLLLTLPRICLPLRYRLRFVVLEANRLKLYQVDDKMMPIYTELVKELVLEKSNY